MFGKAFPQPQMYANWQEWAAALVAVLNEAGPIQPLQLPHVSKTNLPRPSAGLLIFVPDDAAQAQPAFGDGSTTWKRITTGAPVA